MIIRPGGFYDSDNIWDIYAEQFAPDATPDEIETFTGSFPDLSKDQEASYHLLPAHAVQFYGAVAVRATIDNPDLQQHGAQKLIRSAEHLVTTNAYVSPQLVGYIMDGLSAAGRPAEAIKIAEKLASQGGAYNPQDHARLLRNIAESFELHGISAATYEKDYWELSQTALDTQAQAKATAKNMPRQLYAADAVLHHTITELYKHADKQEVVDFCEEHQLYPELVTALHSIHDRVPSKTLDKAIDAAAKYGTADTIKNLAHICIENDDESSARRLIGRLPGNSQHTFWIEVRKNIITQAAQRSDFDTAVHHAKKMDNITDSLRAMEIINKALIEKGDTEAFIRVNKMLPSFGKQTTYSEYTALMAMRAGDTERALALASADSDTRTSWWLIAKDYLHQHLQNGTPESISIDVVCNFIEIARSDSDSDLSFLYAEGFKILHQSGQIELARELAARFKGTPGHLRNFSSLLRPLAINDVIASGDWGKAMHGDHLQDPEGGLVLSRHIILIAGGIHRARTQRKQQQTAQMIESSSNNLL